MSNPERLVALRLATVLLSVTGCDSSEAQGSGHQDGAVNGLGGSDGGMKDASQGGGDATPGPLPPPHDGKACGFDKTGRLLNVAPDIEVCAPAVVCTSETCPPSLGSCVGGQCNYKGNYKGLLTLPQAWATHYCDLSGQGCRGVTQVEFPEVTAGQVSAALGLPPCFQQNGSAEKCVGIMAAPPMMVGNSQEAIDPVTGKFAKLWGLGMTEATGFCYEITGPGGTAVLAVTDRCGGHTVDVVAPASRSVVPA